MTLEDFCALDRIPTPPEFVAFARGQGWRFRVADGGAALIVPDRNDPLAVALARMLSREPYRTNVLALLEPKLVPRPAAAEPSSDPHPAIVRAPAESPRDRVLRAYPGASCFSHDAFGHSDFTIVSGDRELTGWHATEAGAWESLALRLTAEPPA